MRCPYCDCEIDDYEYLYHLHQYHSDKLNL